MARHRRVGGTLPTSAVSFVPLFASPVIPFRSIAISDAEQGVAATEHVVSVEVAGYDATTDTASLAAGDEHCLRLQFYLGASTLHWEHQAYAECESDADA